jgi:hypothetical protein
MAVRLQVTLPYLGLDQPDGSESSFGSLEYPHEG